jgi:hypothetical protein
MKNKARVDPARSYLVGKKRVAKGKSKKKEIPSDR